MRIDMLSRLENIRGRLHLDRILGWVVVLLAASIPVSVFADNLLLVIMLLVLPLYWKDLVGQVRRNSAVRVGFPLFSLLFVLVWYGNGTIGYSVDILLKYVDLMLIPFFVVAMTLPNVRWRAEYAFLLCSGSILVLSYMLKLGIIHQQPWMWYGAEEFGGSIFRHYLVQNFLMAYAVYLAMLKARHAETAYARWGWRLFVLLGLVNIFGVVIGRTGQIVMLVLLLWFVLSSTRFTRLNYRWKVWGGLGLAFVLVLFPIIVERLAPDSAFNKRFSLALVEATTWRPGVMDESSVGARLGFYYRSLELFKESPIIGYGTGGFQSAYASKGSVSGTEKNLANPHNQYLLIAVQAGIIGVAALLGLFIAAWNHCRSVTSAYDRSAGLGLLLAIMVDGLFNSPLLDHTDGLFFAYMFALWISGEVDEGRSA